MGLVLAACAGAQPAESGERLDTSTVPVDVAVSTTVAPAPRAPAAPATTSPVIQPCADVVDVTVTPNGDTWTVSATVRSGDTGWDKYTDVWKVYADGAEIAERVLAHPHETEQPFTRSVSGVVIPDGVDAIEVAARDSVNGFCGRRFSYSLTD